MFIARNLGIMPGDCLGRYDKSFIAIPEDNGGVLVKVGDAPMFLLGIRAPSMSAATLKITEGVSITSVGDMIVPCQNENGCYWSSGTANDTLIYRAADCVTSGGTIISGSMYGIWRVIPRPDEVIYIGLLMKPNTNYILQGNLAFTFRIGI